MPDTTPRIAELKDRVGRTVTVRGWVTHVRSSGKVAFAVIRDGTGVMQAVFVKTQIPPEAWERFKELTLETSVHVTGEIRAEPRSPGGYEMGVTGLTIHVFNSASVEFFTTSGNNPVYGTSGWELQTPSTGTWFVEIVDANHLPISNRATADVVSDCAKNLAVVNFEQK